MSHRGRLAAALVIAGCGGAQASTFEFAFAGTVTAQSVTANSGATMGFAAVLGRSFSSQFSFDDTGGGVIGQGSVSVDLTGHPGQFIAPAEVAGAATGTYTADLDPTLVRQADGIYTGHVTSILGPTFDFTYDPKAASATIAADFAASVFNRADDSGEISLILTATRATSNVSSVPLPAAAPLFGLALIGMGAFARRRGTTEIR